MVRKENERNTKEADVSENLKWSTGSLRPRDRTLQYGALPDLQSDPACPMYVIGDPSDHPKKRPQRGSDHPITCADFAMRLASQPAVITGSTHHHRHQGRQAAEPQQTETNIRN
ncbi:hypothetical protein PGT21_016252 [Puccinia graminis f. sp. tritici]|uniref:Uncharacterized protein n=1 Tax=Puccinia graminis f. sp. tritici TaxID=56615 RepID=A0A5B0QAT4_PUCGR|nr:hypothetical protein PGT21_016252 [Puccinia graminis f. sp. tritici]KAA1128663.1 hypothetical protein PGTUg99_021816 [Puccinia graminis f. sp. tritici]